MRCSHHVGGKPACSNEAEPKSLYCKDHFTADHLDARFGRARHCRKCQERFRCLDPNEAYCAGCRKVG